MSRQSELAELSRIYDSSALSNRNLIINGGMEVAQRGTSSTSGGYVSLDRWYVNQSGGSTTFSQETNSNPSETNGLQKYARLNVSSSSDFTAILQRIEDVTSVPTGTITVSFYAKGTAPTGGLKVWCTQVFGSGGSSDVDIAEQVIAASLTSSWVRYTLNITVPSVDGKTIGTGSYFMVTIGQGTDTASTAYDLNITGVQLEVGDTATPFEHRSYGDELLRCYRYFYKVEKSGYIIGRGNGTSGVTDVRIPCPVALRAQPSFDATGTSNALDSDSYVSATNVGFTHTNTSGASVNGQITGLSNMTDNRIGAVSLGDGYSLDAEL